MKTSLEYVILKFLFENRNSKPIDVAHLYNDNELLFSSLIDLAKRDLIEIEKHPSKPDIRDNWMGIIESKKPPKGKITFLGIEQLRKIQADEINIELSEKTLKEFPRTKLFANISIIVSLILFLKELYNLIFSK